jgi:fatty-acyl-CoA synthase
VLALPQFAGADLSRLRLTVNVGSPGSLRRMQAALPGVPQVSAFGGTEYGGFATLGQASESLEERVETSGRPVAGVELRAIDLETGADVPVGEVGEALIRGPQRFACYHGDPEATARAIDADGWYHSGDLIRIDDGGRVAFVGRSKDMLKVGGENVAAVEVETFLLTHPAVAIAQVVAAPDARYVEVPAAFVQLRAGETCSERELIDHCIGRIATFKVPRYVRFVEEWPMSGTKIQKFRLREWIAEELARAGITEAPKIRS